MDTKVPVLTMIMNCDKILSGVIAMNAFKSSSMCAEGNRRNWSSSARKKENEYSQSNEMLLAPENAHAQLVDSSWRWKV